VPKTECVRRGERMTTRARVLARNERGKARARGVGRCRALRAEALRRGRPTPGGRPRFRRPVAARRYASLRHRAGRSVRAARHLRPDQPSAAESTASGFSPQTGARLSGGRPEPVKGAPSARPFGQTLDKTTAASPPDPIAPVGLRGGAGEAAPPSPLILPGKKAWQQQETGQILGTRTRHRNRGLGQVTTSRRGAGS
jgi:hypothetical protein